MLSHTFRDLTAVTAGVLQLSIIISLASAASITPTVHLDDGIFIGVHNETTNRFLGIPFAQPPVGDLRLRRPLPNKPYTGVHNATAFGLGCPQQALSFDFPPNFSPAAVAALGAVTAQANLSHTGEDCLNINVWQPAGLSAGVKLPVIFWIFGGGFESGDADPFDGAVIVNRSIELGEPVIYASINYRVSVFGFLGGQEVKAAGVGNLGLLDQREALRWVQKYISAFNGDPSRVTIWGESSGAISVALQMLANDGNTEGLFHGAFMQSGSPPPTGDIVQSQPEYDNLVASVGCQNASDTLECLRQAPFDTLKAAMDASANLFGPQALNISTAPRADGVFLRNPPQQAVLKGKVADIPFVTGDCDDEGTLFSLSQNLTSDEEFRAYVSGNYFPDATPDDIDKILEAYPQDPTEGSPFGTGNLNALTSQYKRVAAFQGDLVFLAPRRFFLQNRSSKQPTWSFLWKRFKSLPDLGSFHSSDLTNSYGPGEITDYLIHFANHLDPNGKGSVEWPRYTTSAPMLMTFLDGPVPQNITKDEFRTDAMDLLTQLSAKFPL
ncbi:alpha beta-hydrolase [Cytidiella melzeri]|nr:alpha beta-hydrolase [Cytidiella melzeri]